MPIYTVIITGLDGHQHSPVTEFRDDATAISDAREVLTHEHRSVAVGRGSGEAIEFLGIWDRGEDGDARWTPED